MTLYQQFVGIVGIVDVVYDMTTTPHTLLLLLANEKYYKLAKITKDLGYFTYSTLQEETGLSKPIIQKFLDVMRQFKLVKEVESIKNRRAPASILFKIPTATEVQYEEAIKKYKDKKITNILPTHISKTQKIQETESNKQPKNDWYIEKIKESMKNIRS